MRFPAILLTAFLATAAPALAAEVTVLVRTADGQPVRDAVATLRFPGDAARAASIKFSWPYVVTQQNLQFDPFVLIVPVGSDVAFPNKDKVRHHVYSFSPAKRFELRLYGREEARTVTFDKVGVVAIGCNIHDQMIGFVDVVDTPFAAKSDAAGAARIADAPAGSATLTIWHPYMKAPANQLSRTIAVPRQGELQETVVVDIRPPGGGAAHIR